MQAGKSLVVGGAAAALVYPVAYAAITMGNQAAGTNGSGLNLDFLGIMDRPYGVRAFATVFVSAGAGAILARMLI
jgi:hypothetical protein